MATSRKVRISNEVLNSYGTRLITAGGDLEHYRRNPVLLYMHERGKVIGTIESLAVEGSDVVGVLVFDGASDLSKTVAAQWEKGSLRMVSAGIQIIEMSDDPSVLVKGQTSPTITKWKLREVSVVDIASNPDAVRLFDRDGQELTLSDNGGLRLPKLNLKPDTQTMDQKQLALSLGLAENATVEQIQARIAELKAAADMSASLKQENDAIKLAAINAAVEQAVQEKRLSADKKDQFVQLGQKLGLADLKTMLEAMQPAQKASRFIENGGSGASGYRKLSDVPSDKLMELREQDPSQYKQLYRAEYGVECEL